MISLIVSQFLFGCSLNWPVRYCLNVSALLLCVNCTRKGFRNSSNSGIGARGACGSRLFSFDLMLMSSGYNAIIDFDKVVLGAGDPIPLAHYSNLRDGRLTNPFRG